MVPIDPVDAAGNAPKLRHELRAFRRSQIWLSLAIAMIGGVTTASLASPPAGEWRFARDGATTEESPA